jgi:hypothetical protein
LIHGKIAMMREQKITLGEMRANNGPRRLLVYCSDFKCSQSVTGDAAPWSDDVRLSRKRPWLLRARAANRGRSVFFRAVTTGSQDLTPQQS